MDLASKKSWEEAESKTDALFQKARSIQSCNVCMAG